MSIFCHTARFAFLVSALGASQTPATAADSLDAVANSNPKVQQQLQKEKNRDEVIDFLVDAVKGPAGSSGAVQRSQEVILEDITTRAGSNSAKKMRDEAKPKMYRERAKAIFVEQTGRQDVLDRQEMEAAEGSAPSPQRTEDRKKGADVRPITRPLAPRETGQSF